MELGALNEFGDIISVMVNEKRIELPKFASVNGVLQSGYYDIQEDDQIELLNYYTVKQIADFMDVIIDSNMNVYVNNTLADIETYVYENFTVSWMLRDAAESVYNQHETDRHQKTEGTPAAEKIPILEEQAEAAPEAPKVPTVIAVIVNGKPVALTGKPSYVFVDVFDHIDFDLSSPKGSGVVTLLNGRDAKYMETLHSGDNIEIYWKP